MSVYLKLFNALWNLGFLMWQTNVNAGVLGVCHLVIRSFGVVINYPKTEKKLWSEIMY